MYLSFLNLFQQWIKLDSEEYEKGDQVKKRFMKKNSNWKLYSFVHKISDFKLQRSMRDD